MECPYCNAENLEGTQYCRICGRLMAISSVIPCVKPTMSFGSKNAPIAQARNLSQMTSSLVAGLHLQGGRYIVKRMLGQGGMGAALLAADTRLDGKLVVLKELVSSVRYSARKLNDVHNFKQEVVILAHLDHPLIPSVTDHFQEGSHYFMVQEYIEGENLEACLDRTRQPMKERDVLICASEILDILIYLAQQSPPVIHRDIKPANIIVGSRDKHAHLVDFGIARSEEARDADRKQSSALGTPGYASPEQYLGNADLRSDLYALAATLHHLLTNRDPRDHPPFNFPSIRSLNPSLSSNIEHVLRRALCNDRSQRYQSALAMKQDVDAILSTRFGISGKLNNHMFGTSTVPAGEATVENSVSLGTGMTVTMVTGSSTSVQPLSFSKANNSKNCSTDARRRQTTLWLVLVLVVFAIIVVNVVARFVFLKSPAAPTSTSTATLVSTLPALGSTKKGGELIGISDGSFVFDTTRQGASSKLLAAQAIRQNRSDVATSYLGQAIAIDSSDAEAHIYLEDQRVLASGSPYITLIVATMISGDNTLVGLGRDSLQGVYVAQKEYNDGGLLPNGVKVRLLIANTGSNVEYVDQIARQIVKLTQVDKTFVGVMGWPYSAHCYNSVKILGEAHIPIVSATASADVLSGISPYFFRVAPSNAMQAVAGADYATNTLHAKKIAVFVDPGNIYSQSLAQHFVDRFRANGGQIVAEKRYVVGKPENLGSLLNDVLRSRPDLIYFAGYVSDVTKLLANLPDSDLSVLGGDALYSLSGYKGSSLDGFTRLHFTAFAYPDEWEVLGYPERKPSFFTDYPAIFDPKGSHPSGVYGFTRANSDVIMAFDAMLALLNGCSKSLMVGKTTLAHQDLLRGLQSITGTGSIQGVSGQIAFNKQGDVVNKMVVILSVDSSGCIHMERGLGQFLKN